MITSCNWFKFPAIGSCKKKSGGTATLAPFCLHSNKIILVRQDKSSQAYQPARRIAGHVTQVTGNEWQHLEFTLPISKAFFSLLSLQTFTCMLLLSLAAQTSKHEVNRCFFRYVTRFMKFKPFYFSKQSMLLS